VDPEHQLVAPVAAAVIHEDDLGRAVKLVDDRGQAAMEERQYFFFVIDGDDE
jgi:hypothetical protein